MLVYFGKLLLLFIDPYILLHGYYQADIYCPWSKKFALVFINTAGEIFKLRRHFVIGHAIIKPLNNFNWANKKTRINAGFKKSFAVVQVKIVSARLLAEFLFLSASTAFMVMTCTAGQMLTFWTFS